MGRHKNVLHYIITSFNVIIAEKFKKGKNKLGLRIILILYFDKFMRPRASMIPLNVG
jgi:hypothetical protein